MSKICQKCSAEMADNMNFCPKCRTKYEAQLENKTNLSINSNSSKNRVHELAKLTLSNRRQPVDGQIVVSSCDNDYITFKVAKIPWWLMVFSSIIFNSLVVVAKVQLDKNGDIVSKSYKYQPSFEGYLSGLASLIMCIAFIGFGSIFGAIGGFVGFLIGMIFIALPVAVGYFEICAAKEYLAKRLDVFKKDFVPNQRGFLVPERSTINLRGKTPVEIARQCFTLYSSAILEDEKFYLAPNLDEASLNFAISNYAKDVNKQDVICMLVTSQNTGMLCTTKGIYATVKTGLIKSKAFGSYKDIIGTRDMNDREVFVKNDGNLIFYRKTPIDSLNSLLVNLREELLIFVRAMQDF